MMPYLLRREQFIPFPVEEVFAFFAQAENLAQLTPDWMHFRILTPLPIVMTQGTVIDYRIHWGWVPMYWRTEITVWEAPFRFVDVQLRGPYKRWEHTHEFQRVNGGTLMTDVVEYSLPLGPLGRTMHWLLVRRDLQTIFDYRCQRIATLFGANTSREPQPSFPAQATALSAE
jgi:ligand-binding SRPBCC domain-containing protein